MGWEGEEGEEGVVGAEGAEGVLPRPQVQSKRRDVKSVFNTRARQTWMMEGSKGCTREVRQPEGH